MTLYHSFLTSQIVVAPPPGFSGSSWLAVGNVAPDINVVGLNEYFPFCINFSPLSLGNWTDVQGMFREFQVRALTLTVQTLTPDDSSIASKNQLPEIITAADPGLVTPFPTATAIQNIESYAQTKRTFLTANNKHTVKFAVRPQILAATVGAGDAPGVYNENTQALWFDTGDAAGTLNWLFSGLGGVVRSFPSDNTGAIPSYTALRFSLTADLVARRSQ
jgi:hypothetical protein